MERCPEHTGYCIVYVAIHWSNDNAVHYTLEIKMGKREIKVGSTTVVITGVPDDINQWRKNRIGGMVNCC